MQLHVRLLSFERHHLPDSPGQRLAVACELGDGGEIQRACITDVHERLETLARSGHALDVIAQLLGVAVLDYRKPWRLKPVHIPKPWGQEIWYTGIEMRGVSQVVSDSGTTPLDWAIAVDSLRALGMHHQPTLLKILDPLPDDVFGDLYFELHERKREVYVVTHVDQQAWPDGVGAIRYGFAPERRAQFKDEATFIEAYRTAVHNYRRVRLALDVCMDDLRRRDGVGLQEPVSAVQTQRWLSELPLDVRSQEAALRAEMDSFTALRALRVGDVLAVPLCTPHALQHGVRTVEFQTPVYERKILSFAQKVLTQDHWDTEAALQLAEMHTPEDVPFPVLHCGEGVQVEQIVTFDDFSVQRIHLAPGAEYVVSLGGDHAVWMGVAGSVCVGGELLGAEVAALVPAAVVSLSLKNKGQQAAIGLLAVPA